jgi:hypothetical protein
MRVYEVFAICADGSEVRHRYVYATRELANAAAEQRADHDPAYNHYGGRWKMKVRTLTLVTPPHLPPPTSRPPAR